MDAGRRECVDADPTNPCIADGRGSRCVQHDQQWNAHMNRYYVAAHRFRTGKSTDDPGTPADAHRDYKPQPIVGYLGLSPHEADQLESLAVDAETALRTMQANRRDADAARDFENKTERLVEHLDSLFMRRSQS
jgi:hypothetical protein